MRISLVLALTIWLPGCALTGSDGKPCHLGQAVTQPQRCGTRLQVAAFRRERLCEPGCERALSGPLVYRLDGTLCTCETVNARGARVTATFSLE